MAEQAENQTSAGQPDGGFRGRVLAAIAEPRHEVLCINALTARVEQGSFTADEAREMRTLVLEQVRAATKQRTKRAWAMLYAVLERADLKAIGDLLRQAPPSGVTHNTQVNIDARGNQELVAELKKQLTLAEREKLLEKLESGTGGNGNGKH